MMDMTDIEIYLAPTAIIDSDHRDIIDFARETVGGSRTAREKAVKLYYAVRDGVWYDPYYPFYKPEHYRASHILKSRRGYCVCKASLLCALGRACQIPARLGFADVRNHLATKELIEYMGSDIFIFHGFVEFHLEGRWVKATPAFNIELCKKHHVAPLEFNGRDDSIFQPYNLEEKKFMEYIAERGTYADVPVDLIVSAFEETYGKGRVREWIEDIENSGGKPHRDFYKEKVLKTDPI